MTSISPWLPTHPSDARVLTGARLDEGDASDRITLYVLGDRVAEFNVPVGVGAKLLAECGLARHP